MLLPIWVYFLKWQKTSINLDGLFIVEDQLKDVLQGQLYHSCFWWLFRRLKLRRSISHAHFSYPPRSPSFGPPEQCYSYSSFQLQPECKAEAGRCREGWYGNVVGEWVTIRVGFRLIQGNAQVLLSFWDYPKF